MCAINGYLGENRELGERMNSATAHRGPDSSRVQVESAVTFGHNRLAIIDLEERSSQPMESASGRYVIIFNGEIYNFRALREELAPYLFKTEGDTEVILAAYERWGVEAFTRLNGIFALALWDREEKTLLLVRDPQGIKPLYYAHLDGHLVFSSEMKALFAAGVPRTLNTPSLSQYLRLMYVPDPDTLIAGIKTVPRGHLLRAHAGSTVVESYAKEVVRERPQSYTDAKQLVRNEVEAAVARQLVSDRPVGIYLSGGIDSSAVLASASLVHPHINTYSVGFALSEGEEVEKFNADSDIAARTAHHFGATHHSFSLSTDDALSLAQTVACSSDQPIGNATLLAQYYLASKVKPTATVVLSGEGGDELFGGYERYRLAHIAQVLGPYIPEALASLVSRLQKVHLSGLDRFAQLMFQEEEVLSQVLREPASREATRVVFASYFSGGDIVRELMRADESGWLVGEALMRADIAGMASSVEVRVPLLDREVVALAHTLPTEWLVTFGSTKRILKDAFRDRLPEELFRQPKRGWFSPGAKWLRHPGFVALADEAFSASYAPHTASLFDFDAIRALWEAHRGKRAYHFTMLWAVLMFQLWAREHDVRL